MAQNPGQMQVARNASLLFTKGVPRNLVTFNTEEKAPIFESVASTRMPGLYRDAFERWKQQLRRLPGATLAASFEVEDRLAVGIGAPTVLETSLSMNRMWGTPIIPGSGLKGLIHHYARWLAEHGENGPVVLTPERLLALTGSETESGVVDWLDAWWVPDEETTLYDVDVVTPHYSSWYFDGVAPNGTQDPIPSNLLTARGSFLLAVHAPNIAWARAAMALLKDAVQLWGVGAKTNAGYGYLVYKEEVLELETDLDITPNVADIRNDEGAGFAAGVDDGLRSRLEEGLQLQGDAFFKNVQDWVGQWKGLTDDSVRHALGVQFLEKLTTRASEYWKYTGIPLPGYMKAPGKPKGYMREFLQFMDHPPAEEES